MSIRDKVRDSLYGSEEDDRESEASAAGIGWLTDSLEAPWAAEKALLYAGLFETYLVAIQFFAPNSGWNIANLMDLDTLPLAVISLFVSGFVIGYASHTMWRRTRIDKENSEHVESGMMSGYSGYSRRQGSIAKWFAASAGGVGNIVVIYLLRSMII